MSALARRQRGWPRGRRRSRPSSRAYGFDAAYTGRPGWDIGRPQRAFVALADSGEIRGSVLDAGCGTGETAVFLAGRGHPVLGIDFAPRAVESARRKAAARGSAARFLVWDALDLDALGEQFDTVVDSALLHCFDGRERDRFVAGLRTVLRPGGTYFVLFASAPDWAYGQPGGVSPRELRDRFGDGWRVDYVRDAGFETRFAATPHPAYLASVTRL